MTSEDRGWSPRARAGSMYWLVGVVAFAAIVYVLLGTLRAGRGRPAGPAVGATLPPFAAPLARSRLEGDVNVARRDGQGAAGTRAACSVRRPDVVTTCALARRGPVVLAFFTAGAARCVGELDVVDRVARRHRRVQVAAIALRGDRGALRRLVLRRRWSFPVAQDRDGILANLYGVVVCPHLTFAAQGGRVRGTVLGQEDAASLERRFADLERTGAAR